MMTTETSSPAQMQQLDMFTQSAGFKNAAYEALFHFELDEARSRAQRYLATGGTQLEYDRIIAVLDFWVNRLSELMGRGDSSAEAIALAWFEFEQEACARHLSATGIDRLRASVYQKIVDLNADEPDGFVLPDYPVAYFAAFGEISREGLERLDACLVNHPERASLIQAYLADASYLLGQIPRAQIYFQLAFARDPMDINLDAVQHPELRDRLSGLRASGMPTVAIPHALFIEEFLDGNFDIPPFGSQAAFDKARDDAMLDIRTITEVASLPERLDFWRRTILLLGQNRQRFSLSDDDFFALREKLREIHPEYFQRYLTRVRGVERVNSPQ